MVLNGMRWLCVPISAILGWYVVLILGIALVDVVESFCPTDKMVSGFCAATWVNNIIEVLVYIVAGLSAIVVVLLPTLVAPKT